MHVYSVEANTKQTSVFYRRYSVFLGNINTDIGIGIGI